jgi:hypothetical protein
MKKKLGVIEGVISSNRNAFFILLLILPIDRLLYPGDYAIQCGHRRNLECQTLV